MLSTADSFGLRAPDPGGWLVAQRLGENWRALKDAGVAQVTLLDGDRPVYGPMGLDTT